MGARGGPRLRMTGKGRTQRREVERGVRVVLVVWGAWGVGSRWLGVTSTLADEGRGRECSGGRRAELS